MGISVAPTPRAERILHRPVARGRIAARAATALLVASLATAALVAIGALAGFRGEVILTGSMAPRLAPGDLVVVREVPVTSIGRGDIISFRGRSGITITHRVKAAVRRLDGRLNVTTQGDANNAAEHWVADRDARVGRVSATLPGVGKVTNWSGTATGRLLVLGAIGLLGGGLALRRIWAG